MTGNKEYVDILAKLPQGKPIPGALLTAASRLRKAPDGTLTDAERAFLELYAQRTKSSKTTAFFQHEEHEGPSAEIAIAGVYDTAIASHKEMAQLFITQAGKLSEKGTQALIEVVKVQQRSLENAAEREELAMDRLRRADKRADKYEGKYRKMQDELDDLYKEIEELRAQKDQATTFEKILELGGKILAVKNGAN